MSEQLPPEPPFYDVDEETRDLLVDLVEFGIQYKNAQRNPDEGVMIQSVLDTICERFGLLVEQTEYDIEQLENGDILWRLLQPKPDRPSPLKLVTDNVTPIRKDTDDSDS